MIQNSFIITFTSPLVYTHRLIFSIILASRHLQILGDGFELLLVVLIDDLLYFLVLTNRLGYLLDLFWVDGLEQRMVRDLLYIAERRVLADELNLLLHYNYTPSSSIKPY